MNESSIITPIRFVYDTTINPTVAILPTDVSRVAYDFTYDSGTNELSYKTSDGLGGFSSSTITLTTGTGGGGQTILVGDDDPDNSIGVDGQLYWNRTTTILWIKDGTGWQQVHELPDQNRGPTINSGTSLPLPENSVLYDVFVLITGNVNSLWIYEGPESYASVQTVNTTQTISHATLYSFIDYSLSSSETVSYPDALLKGFSSTRLVSYLGQLGYIFLRYESGSSGYDNTRLQYARDDQSPEFDIFFIDPEDQSVDSTEIAYAVQPTSGTDSYVIDLCEYGDNLLGISMGAGGSGYATGDFADYNYLMIYDPVGKTVNGTVSVGNLLITAQETTSNYWTSSQLTGSAPMGICKTGENEIVISSWGYNSVGTPNRYKMYLSKFDLTDFDVSNPSVSDITHVASVYLGEDGGSGSNFHLQGGTTDFTDSDQEQAAVGWPLFGLDSDGTYLWGTNNTNALAYNVSDLTRDSSKDISFFSSTTDWHRGLALISGVAYVFEFTSPSGTNSLKVKAINYSAGGWTLLSENYTIPGSVSEYQTIKNTLKPGNFISILPNDAASTITISSTETGLEYDSGITPQIIDIEMPSAPFERQEVNVINDIYTGTWAYPNTWSNVHPLHTGNTDVRSIDLYDNRYYSLDYTKARIYYSADLAPTGDSNWTEFTTLSTSNTNPIGMSIYKDQIYIVDDTTNALYVSLNLSPTGDTQWNTITLHSENTSPIDIKVYKDKLYVLDDTALSIFVSDQGNLNPTVDDHWTKLPLNVSTVAPLGIEIYKDRFLVIQSANVYVSSTLFVSTDADWSLFILQTGDIQSAQSIAVRNSVIYIADKTGVDIHYEDLDEGTVTYTPGKYVYDGTNWVTYPRVSDIYTPNKSIIVGGSNITLTTDDTAQTITIDANITAPTTITVDQATVYGPVKSILQAGSNINITPDDIANTLTISATAFVPSQANLYTSVDAILKAGTNIDIAEDATNNTLTISTTPQATFSPTQANLYSSVQPMLVQGNNIILTPESSTNTISIAATQFSPTTANLYSSVEPMIVQGTNITLTKDSSANTITIAADTQAATTSDVYTALKSILSVSGPLSTTEDDTAFTIVLTASSHFTPTVSNLEPFVDALIFVAGNAITKSSTGSGVTLTVNVTQANTYTPAKSIIKGGVNVTVTPDDTNQTLNISSTDTDTVFDPTDANLYPGVASMLQEGTNVTLDEDASNNTITINSSYTDTVFSPTTANLYPSVEPMIVKGSNITLDKSSTNNTITINAINTQLDDAGVYGHLKNILQPGTDIQLVQNNTTNTIGINWVGTFTQFSPSQSNLYSSIKTMLIGGTNVTVTPDDNNSTLTIISTASGGGSSFTPSQSNIYPAVKPMLLEGSNITLTKNDTNNSITINSSYTDTVFTPSQSNLYTAVASIFVQGSNVTLDKSSTNNTITVTGPTPGTTFSPTQANIYPPVNLILVGGQNVTLTPDNTANTITIDSPDTQFVPTASNLDLVVDSILVGGSNITTSLNTTNNTITISSTQFSPSQSNLYSSVKSIMKAGKNVTLTTDDTNNTITVSSDEIINGLEFEVENYDPLNTLPVGTLVVPIDDYNSSEPIQVSAKAADYNDFPDAPIGIVVGSEIPAESGDLITGPIPGLGKIRVIGKDIVTIADEDTSNPGVELGDQIYLVKTGSGLSTGWEIRYIRPTSGTWKHLGFVGELANAGSKNYGVWYDFSGGLGQEDYFQLKDNILVDGTDYSWSYNDTTEKIGLTITDMRPTQSNTFTPASSILVGGDNVTIASDSSAETLTINAHLDASNLYSGASNLLVGGNAITLTGDSSANTITIAATLTNVYLYSGASSLLVAGTSITLTGNTTDNTITIAASLGASDLYSGVNSIMTAGSNITITGNTTNNTLTIAAVLGASNLYSGVNSIMTAGNNITLTGDSSANTVTVSANLAASNLYTGASNLLVAGTDITLTGDSSANTITITNSPTAANLVSTLDSIFVAGTDMEIVTYSNNTIQFNVIPSQANMYTVVKPMILGGTDISLTKNDTDSTITVNAAYTKANLFNIFTTTLVEGTNIEFVEDSANNFITINLSLTGGSIYSGINSTLVAGTNVTIDQDLNNYTLTVNATVTQDTVYSPVDSILEAGTNITLTADSVTKAITISAGNIGSGSGNSFPTSPADGQAFILNKDLYSDPVPNQSPIKYKYPVAGYNFNQTDEMSLILPLTFADSGQKTGYRLLAKYGYDYYTIVRDDNNTSYNSDRIMKISGAIEEGDAQVTTQNVSAPLDGKSLIGLAVYKDKFYIGARDGSNNHLYVSDDLTSINTNSDWTELTLPTFSISDQRLTGVGAFGDRIYIATNKSNWYHSSDLTPSASSDWTSFKGPLTSGATVGSAWSFCFLDDGRRVQLLTMSAADKNLYIVTVIDTDDTHTVPASQLDWQIQDSIVYDTLNGSTGWTPKGVVADTKTISILFTSGSSGSNYTYNRLATTPWTYPSDRAPTYEKGPHVYQDGYWQSNFRSRILTYNNGDRNAGSEYWEGKLMSIPIRPFRRKKWMFLRIDLDSTLQGVSEDQYNWFRIRMRDWNSLGGYAEGQVINSVLSDVIRILLPVESTSTETVGDGNQVDVIDLKLLETYIAKDWQYSSLMIGLNEDIGISKIHYYEE